MWESWRCSLPEQSSKAAVLVSWLCVETEGHVSCSIHSRQCGGLGRELEQDPESLHTWGSAGEVSLKHVSSDGASRTQPKSCFPKLQCSHQGGTELCVSSCCAQGCSQGCHLCVPRMGAAHHAGLECRCCSTGQKSQPALGRDPELIPCVAHGQHLWECPTDMALVVHETLPDLSNFPPH